MQQPPFIWGFRIMRAAVAIILLLALGGCAGEVPAPDQPTMYLSMANGGAKLDPQAAASMISLYRENNGLGGVAVGPDLMKLAGSPAPAKGSPHKPDHHRQAPPAPPPNTTHYTPPLST